MGESRKHRRAARKSDTLHARAAKARALGADDRRLLSRYQVAMGVVGFAGLLWPAGISIYAEIHGRIIGAAVPQHGRHRYAQVAYHWPDFTAPWPIPVAVVIALVAVTVLTLRRRSIAPLSMFTIAFAWLAAGIGITFVGSMYIGADDWPRWQLAIGIPALIIGGILWLVNRRWERQLLNKAQPARR